MHPGHVPHPACLPRPVAACRASRCCRPPRPRSSSAAFRSGQPYWQRRCCLGKRWAAPHCWAAQSLRPGAWWRPCRQAMGAVAARQSNDSSEPWRRSSEELMRGRVLYSRGPSIICRRECENVQGAVKLVHRDRKRGIQGGAEQYRSESVYRAGGGHTCGRVKNGCCKHTAVGAGPWGRHENWG